MFIKIKKASDKSCWYKDKIGESFHVLENSPKDYIVSSNIHEGYECCSIDKTDAEVISFLGKMVRVNSKSKRSPNLKVGSTGLAYTEIDSDGDYKVAFPELGTFFYVEAQNLSIIESEKLSVRIGDVDVVSGNVIEIDGRLGLIVESKNYKGDKILVICYLEGSSLTQGWDDLNDLSNRDKRITAVYKGMEHAGYGWYPDGLRDYPKWVKEKTVTLDGEAYTKEFYERLKKEFENAKKVDRENQEAVNR